jgi:hypothetical protein
MIARIDNFKPAYAAQEVISCFKLQFYTSKTYEEFAAIVEQHFKLTPEQWESVLNEWETLQIIRVKP